MKKILSIVACFLLIVPVFSQNANRGKIIASIINEQQLPLEGATIDLLRSKDSSLVKIAITDKTGLAEFENISFNTYLVRVSMINYSRYFSVPFTLSVDQTLIQLPKISLQAKSATELKEITVTAKKPFIQKLTDRIAVNVDNSVVNAGSSAFEVLERAPGVLIDPNDNISLRGRQGVIIMIDGKITPMSGSDLVNFLRGLPSNSIERIDIITNPSVKYDAAGNSGIIDIRMKKDQRLGANGTFTAGLGQGVYPKANTGATFNYRNKKVNVFGSYNYAYREGLNHLFLKREFFKNGVYDGAYDQDNFMKFPFNSHTTRVGADFFPNKKTIWGFVLNGSFNHFTRTNDNRSIVLDQSKQAASQFNTATTEKNRFNNVLGNINFKHTFDSTGKEITADADYGVYNNRSISNFITGFYSMTGTQIKPTYKLNGNQEGKITIATLKADYVHPLKNQVRLEAGFKTSFVETDNDVVFYDKSNSTPVYDSSKSNHFNYKENNHAVYMNWNKDSKKWSLMAGLRAELTNLEGLQSVGNIGFDSSYLQLFPSMFVNYKITENKTVGVSVSRRIDRPNYSQLNPFRFFLDPSTYSSGNPALKPQLTWSYELSYTVKQLSFTFGYSHTKENFTVVIRPSETEDKVTIQIPVNLTTCRQCDRR